MKYNNQKIVIDGIRFDSKMEGDRYVLLKDLEKRGVITDLEHHPKFKIWETFKRGKRVIRGITYSADFRYLKSGVVYVEDVKGMQTSVYKLKKKMFLYHFQNLVFREVVKDHGEWREVIYDANV